MDDYSEKTIQLLLHKNRKYLSSILRRYADDVPDDDKITAEYARAVIMSVSQLNINHLNDNSRLSIYVCKKCGLHKVVVREMQMRSADEGSTIVFVCLSCNHRWIS